MRLRRASRGSLVIIRFTRSETPAVCPRWLRWLRHGHVAGRSLPLALLGEKRQLSVRDGCGGCATGKSRGLAAARFTRRKTPAVCPRWLRWLRHGQVAGPSLPFASPGEKRQPCVRDGWLGVIGEPGSVARWLERELRAALPLGNRLLRRKIFLGFLKIPKVFLRPFFRILW